MWSQVPRLLADFNLDLRVRALMTSKRMLLAEPAVIDSHAGRPTSPPGRPWTWRRSKSTSTPTTSRTP